MSIDRVKLINQYGQGLNGGAASAAAFNEKTPDFEQTLNKMVRGNQDMNSLTDILKTAAGGSEKITTSQELEDIFERAADKYDVPVELLKAVAKAESGFNPDAVSKCGAVGIMQLMPGTAKALGVVDSHDPEQNIMGGANYLSQKLKSYDGDITLALAAYNAGSGNVAKYGGVPPFAETQNYIKKIFGYMGDGTRLPDNIVSGTGKTKKVPEDTEDQLYSDMGTEKAYLNAQMQILRQQMDMQQIFASGNADDDDDENLDINALIDSLSRL